MASLVLKATIKAGTTILNYETHTKYLFRSEGCEPIEYDTAFLGQIRTGVRKSFLHIFREHLIAGVTRIDFL